MKKTILTKPITAGEKEKLAEIMKHLVTADSLLVNFIKDIYKGAEPMDQYYDSWKDYPNKDIQEILEKIRDCIHEGSFNLDNLYYLAVEEINENYVEESGRERLFYHMLRKQRAIRRDCKRKDPRGEN